MRIPIFAVYVYPGWHSVEEREKRYGKGWSEWELVLNAKPLFEGHKQPRIPLYIYDDSQPATATYQKKLCLEHGIDCMIYCFYWSRGKRVFEKPLDSAFLCEEEFPDFPFMIMWANRMPRDILPVKVRPAIVIDPARYVYTDKEDFLTLIKFLCQNYFTRKNYLKYKNSPIFYIFDSTFFIRQFPTEELPILRKLTKDLMQSFGFDDVFLIALNPAENFYKQYKLFFDATSHYVFLPDWKGDFLQDYAQKIEERIHDWNTFSRHTELPYFPSVSPGWDASPRGIQNLKKIPKRYPWWPIVINNTPELFASFLHEACKFTLYHNKDLPLVHIASLNEWSEGHYLEPDKEYGFDWLKTIKSIKVKFS